MGRKGQTATVLFCALGLGGMLTLFSQASALRDRPERVRALNVSSPESEVFRSVVPATIESGAPLDAESRDAAEDADRPKPPVRLRLR